MKRSLLLMVCAVAAFVYAGSAFAEPGRSAVCKADVQKFCASTEPGAGRIFECLSGHAAELEAGCKAQVDEMTKKHAAWESACGADAAKHCASEGKGAKHHKSMQQCLGKHQAELAPACQAVLMEMQALHEAHMAQREAVKAACMADMKALCGGKGGKGKRGEMAACMAANEDKLSAPCKEARGSLDPDSAADSVTPPEEAAP